MVAFYNEQDQEIYDKVSKFMPQSEYLLSAPTFTAPIEEEETTETFGIPNTNAFTNSRGDNYTSGYNFNNNSFQQAVDARQERLNTPIDTSTFMGKAQSFLTPQSAQSIIEDGYQEPRFQPGIIGTMLGKVDNYRNLPRADQAFISSQMGYTGPTIFGENNSGLGKDEFGINTRSLFGNYAEYVDKKGKSDMTDKEFADYVAGLKGLPKRMALTYRQKSILKNKIQQDTLDQQMADDKKYGAKGMSDPNDKSRAGSLGRRPGSGGTVDRVTEGPGQNVDNTGQAYDSGGREGFGYGLKEGGRAGYFFGGRARLQGGGMSMGNESNQTQSANMGGGATGDFSTSEQTMNHNRAMRDNQKPTESPVTNIINAGSELNYLNNLKNLNLPGIAVGFGVNKFRDFIGNKKTKEEEDKLSALPSNNYFADLNAAQIKQLEGPQKMGKEYGNFSDQDILDNITPFGDDETAPATLKDVQTFYGSNGGLASIL